MKFRNTVVKTFIDSTRDDIYTAKLPLHVDNTSLTDAKSPETNHSRMNTDVLRHIYLLNLKELSNVAIFLVKTEESKGQLICG